MISVIIPVYNEGKYIRDCVESLLLQDYPLEDMEWIFVDGMSTDSTREILLEYANEYPRLIKVLDNPHKIVPHAMNIGIENACGKYIIRLDAHASYSSDYISKCVYHLDSSDADNVGGVAETKSRGFVGGAIAKMLSSKFGVGNSQFRTSGEGGYVDTVPFGAFRREVFEKWGGYDTRLVRNQDNEMNYRIRKNGGKVLLSNDIQFTYYCRDSIAGIANMAFKNGLWNVITMVFCPGSMGVRHFVPLVFVASLIIGPLVCWVFPLLSYMFALELIAYALLDLIFSVRLASGVAEALLLLILFPVFHISYGCGSFAGIVKLCLGVK